MTSVQKTKTKDSARSVGIIRTSRPRSRRRRQRNVGISGKTRFRAVVRMVINNPWLKEGAAQVSGAVDEAIKTNVMMMDVIAKEKFQNLTIENKAMLRKDAKLRSQVEIDKLYRVIGNLKCFRRFPENVRKDLVASTYFEYYRPGKVIVRQGHQSTFMGFVLRGELEVANTNMDPIFGNLVTEVVTHLTSGAVFGDVSLLHNIPRMATLTAITAVELLILKKEDFDRVLKSSLQAQWDEISTALDSMPYFSNWGQVGRRECCMLSDTCSFNVNDVILGKGTGKPDFGHFVVEGSVSVLQKLLITREGDKVVLCPPHSHGPHIETVIMQVCIYQKTACFNIGEELGSSVIVAEDDVQLLRIPKFLLQQYNTANVWNRTRLLLESRMMSREELFKRLLQELHWTEYKMETCEVLIVPRASNYTTIHDLPYFWRVTNTKSLNGKLKQPVHK